ncbi:MAG: asparagine synthase (glutamine-hydrolyzing) [Puia sp.]
MCGIAGILNREEAVSPDQIRRMTDSMCHRGPDSEGFYLDGELAFGHRRLSIIDLSDAANQPFEDASGRYIIIFNGEIYNYAEIKPLLKDYPFRTQGDTEVILAGYIQWGADCLDHLRGMYTFAIWDKQERELFIARDRLGVKPLYYYLDEATFIFASEIRAVLTMGKIKRKMDPSALMEYFRYQSIGFPFSPIQNICQMEAGTWMRIKNGEVKTHQYWDPTAKNYDFDFTSQKEVRQKVKELLLQSVRRRLVSDVPVGAFLSGGIDSSAVVGLMVEAGDPSPHTFNISFDESEYDESKYANLIGRKFNTRHEQIRLRPDVMLEELTNALDAMDIPSGDGINTYVVSKAIHQKGIRVALSGVGGDELFVGYPIFEHYIRLQQKHWLWKVPAGLRNGFSGFLGKGAKKDRMRQLLSLSSPAIEQVYPVLRQLLSPVALQELTLLNGSDERSLSQQLISKKTALRRLPFFSQVTAAEYLGYTQQTLLKDTDQMSMASSLEIREPFFDQDLVEFVMSIPDHFKVPVYPKSLLVESLKPMLPDEIVHRKKQGFVFPWNEWMKNELRSFCASHIGHMAQRDFIQGEKLILMWNRFLSGDADIRWQEIWLFVVLDYWMDKNGCE